MADVKDCPRCGLVNPPSAERCDCGYDFVSHTVERISHKESQRAQKETKTAENRVQKADHRLPSELVLRLGFLLCPLCFFVANPSSVLIR